MFRKCCCGSSGSTCSDSCLCQSGVTVQHYIQIGFDPQICYWQTGTQETHVPISCTSDIGGMVQDDEFYTKYDSAKTNCRWGNVYVLGRAGNRTWSCPNNCGLCTSNCCWNHPNGGPCYPIGGSCGFPDCDCDQQCCFDSFPLGPLRDACNQRCFDQSWKRFCASGKWKTNIVGMGVKTSEITKPANLEWSFASVRATTNPVTFGNDLNFNVTPPTAGFNTREDGSLVTWGNFPCPPGKTCSSWGITEGCYTGGSNQATHYYGYEKKIGKHYALLTGTIKVKAIARIAVTPQNGSADCYDEQVFPNTEFHGFFFEVYYEGTPTNNSLVFTQVNSVIGPDSSSSFGQPPSTTCKCPGLIEVGEAIQYWKIGGVYASGFIV